MRGTCSAEMFIAATLALALAASPAVAGYPGSTQPGAQKVLPGNLILIRAVPPRNAIISGAGRAVTAPTAPPSSVFESLEGVGAPISDGQAASIAGTSGAGQSGKLVAGAIGGLLGSQAMDGGQPLDRTAASEMAGGMAGALHTGIGALQGALGSLQGMGH